MILILACSAQSPPAPVAPVAPVQLVQAKPPEAQASSFDFEAVGLPPELAAAMVGTSWREGCPTPREDLRLVRLNHYDFEGAVVPGELVVHRDAVEPVRAAFAAAFEARFPIRGAVPISRFGGSDDASMAADNTSAFNCRPIKGSTRWSEHSSGKAIDINPRENPWISKKGTVDPPDAARYADRELREPGMLHADGPVVEAFRDAGWGWGGTWSSLRDYQHFSESGR